ncbi:O-antigen/teichoic acid export membrane protein [Pseudorhizobium tarimense]|uniref:O-antigen/teichoic acid export membrane protein n=1 Tax=Pseudorhizobium tarimense TaxID=1079109 RepID=A0ABV2H952_9HYPH|nr:lipopolysaccharide biosynthesis protein [Pseudorhizobium tarimense]MCJ8520296.1 lipopolysaccharide biosynthesis protein [Pseudorhizobium tarimense]
MAVIETAERFLPQGLRTRLRPWLDDFARTLRQDNETARAQGQALIAFLIRLVSAAIAFVSQIVLARLMGEFEYGIFAFVWVLVVLAGSLSCLGFHTSVIRFLPHHQTEGDMAAARGLLVAARVFTLICASTIAVAGFAFLHFFGDLFQSYWLVPLFLAMVTLPMIALGDVLDGTARANGWTVTALSPTFIFRPTLILLFMVAGVWMGAPDTAVTAMQAALAATYLATLTQYLRLRLRLQRTFGRGKLRLQSRAWLAYSLPIFLIDGIGFLLTNADVVVVGLYLPPDQVGIYFAATKIIVLVQFVAFAVKAAAGPRFSVLLATNDPQELARFAAQVARWSFWPALILGIVLLLTGRQLLGLFGEAFTEGYWLLPILFAGILAKALIGPGETLLSMGGHERLCVLLYGVVLITAIAANVVLIPRLGLTGAAIATSLAMAVEALLLHIALRRTLGIVLFALGRSKTFPGIKAE